MNNQNQLNNAYKGLHNELSESSIAFNVVIILIIIAQVFLIANTELIYDTDSLLFYLTFIPMTIGMYYAYKRMVKDPLMKVIDYYIEAVKQSNLNGDEILNQKLLPDKYLLGRFSKYNMDLQHSAINRLYQGISHLTFSIEESDTPEDFKQSLSYIKAAKPKNEH